MKTRFLSLMMTALITMIALSTAHATVWRVNNIPGVDADFTSIATAISAASAGDTLYVEGSHINYGAVSLNKRLIIIGTGYFLNANDSTQALPNSTMFTTVTVSSSATGGIIYGVDLDNITISANDFTLQRCYIYSASSTGVPVEVATNTSNVSILQNYIRNGYCSSSTSYALEINSNCSNIIVSNNMIMLGAYNCNYDPYAVLMSSSSSAIFAHNVIYGDFRVYNSVVQNNILARGDMSGSSNVVQYNIDNGASFGTGNGNQISVNINNVLTLSGSYSADDDYYELKAGSPALGAGMNGVDIGMYGGSLAYKKSGLPPIPAIFEATVPVSGTTATGINVNIKAKSHK